MMLKLKNKFSRSIIFSSLILTSCAIFGTNNHDTDNKNYLIKPTGHYGIGYRDAFLINTDICPDFFYKQGINEADFSSNNVNHCHEIAIRIYYPSDSSVEAKNTYYEPYLMARNDWIESHNKLSKQDIIELNSLLNIKTFTSLEATPAKRENFPVVIFIPGAGTAVQSYNNYISDIVSHGYVVVGINSLFLNGGIALSNGHIVMPPTSYHDEQGRNENLGDLKFVLNHLQEIVTKISLEKELDLNKVALVGHSRGGMSIVNVLKQKHDKRIKAAILLDPGNLLKEKNYPIQKFNFPIITIWSEKFKTDLHGSALLGKNNFELILKNKDANDIYSDHLNFSDDSTLQYHPAYQVPMAEKVPVGTGNGYKIALAINDYSLAFLNTYLKNIKNHNLLACKTLQDKFILRCGD